MPYLPLQYTENKMASLCRRPLRAWHAQVVRKNRHAAITSSIMQGVTIAGDKQHSELWSLSYTIHGLTHKPSWWEKKKFKISSIGMDNAVLEASTRIRR